MSTLKNGSVTQREGVPCHKNTSSSSTSTNSSSSWGNRQPSLASTTTSSSSHSSSSNSSSSCMNRHYRWMCNGSTTTAAAAAISPLQSTYPLSRRLINPKTNRAYESTVSMSTTTTTTKMLMQRSLPSSELESPLSTRYSSTGSDSMSGKGSFHCEDGTLESNGATSSSSSSSLLFRTDEPALYDIEITPSRLFCTPTSYCENDQSSNTIVNENIVVATIRAEDTEDVVEVILGRPLSLSSTSPMEMSAATTTTTPTPPQHCHNTPCKTRNYNLLDQHCTPVRSMESSASRNIPLCGFLTLHTDDWCPDYYISCAGDDVDNDLNRMSSYQNGSSTTTTTTTTTKPTIFHQEHQLQQIQNKICISLGMEEEIGCWCQPWQESYRSTLMDSPCRLMRHTSCSSSISYNTMTNNNNTTNSNPTTTSLSVPVSVSPIRRPMRILDPVKRRDHLASLRRELNPFAVLDPNTHHQRYNNKQQQQPSSIGQTRSFQIQSTKPKVVVQETSKEKMPLSLASVWECGYGCTLPTRKTIHPSPATIRMQWEEECPTGYDSDPEDYPPVRKTMPTTNTTTKTATTSGITTEALLAGPPSSRPATTMYEFLNERSVLILHDAGKSTVIHFWLERGQRLLNTTILPKFVWRACHDNIFQSSLLGIELLDIFRIRSTCDVDRYRYPFAHPDRLLEIKSVQEDRHLLLETRSPDDRDRFVTMTKLVVSTFAAQLLTHNPIALSMFFVNDTEMIGPGDAPKLLSTSRVKEAWV